MIKDGLSAYRKFTEAIAVGLDLLRKAQHKDGPTVIVPVVHAILRQADSVRNCCRLARVHTCNPLLKHRLNMCISNLREDHTPLNSA